jgi:GTPase SAR1 family protein
MMTSLRILLLGDQSLGKTSIISPALDCEQLSTISIDPKLKTVNINNKIIKYIISLPILE